ncbi:MAG: TlpA disulfide reductase family protein [Candidatus Lernaella stagnicola]|nr:TlpA disulfide reductase family protein [Candidatus Lernaella stagnicola]
MRRFIVLVVALLMAANLAWAVGEKAHDFAIKDTQGKTYSLADHQGKVIVMSFWMTWCVPCKQEFPHLKRLYETYKDQGLEVWSITADSPSDLPKVRSIARRYKLTHPVLLDSDSRVNGMFNKRGDYPLTIVIDQEGKIAWMHIGYKPGEEKQLEDQIKKLLGL